MLTMTSRTKNLKSRMMFYFSQENMNVLRSNSSYTKNLENKMQLSHYSHETKSCRIMFLNSQKERADMISLNSFNHSTQERRKSLKKTLNTSTNSNHRFDVLQAQKQKPQI